MQATAKKISSNDQCTKKRTANLLTLNDPSIIPVVSPVSDTCIQQKPGCACGGGCPRCQGSLAIQAKLKIGAPNDKYEQEADRVADQVMRMPEPIVQRQPLDEEEEETQAKPNVSLPQRQPIEGDDEEEPIQTKPLVGQITPLIQRQELGEEEEELIQIKPLNEMVQRQAEAEEEEEEETLQAKVAPGCTPTVGATPHAKIQSLKGGSQPLPQPTRQFFESRMGFDFSGIRIHSNSQATDATNAVNARAFTMRNNVVFNHGEYSPHSDQGIRLLAHELTHAVQQGATNKSIPSFQSKSLFIPQNKPVENTIQRLMGFEFQTRNVVTKNRKGNSPRTFTRTQTKKKPLRTVKGLKMEVDTGSVIEFVTSAHSKWKDLKPEIEDTVKIVNEIKALPKKARDPSSSISKTNPEVFRGFKTDHFGKVDVLAKPPSFRAKPQSTEGIVLKEYESLLKEHDTRSKIAGKVTPAVITILGTVDTKGKNIDNLEGFLQLIVHYILQAKRKLILTKSGKVRQPKAFFRLMTRVDFASMFRFLSKSEQRIFKQLVNKVPSPIVNATGVSLSHGLFAHGYWGWHPDRRRFRILIKSGKIIMIKKKIKGLTGTGKEKDIHKCGSKGVLEGFCKTKKPIKAVTIKSWFKSIIRAGSRKSGKDIAAPLPTYSGSKTGGFSMGLWNMRTKGVFPFEMRGYSRKDASDWLKFAEEKFLVAAACRPGSNLTHKDTATFDKKKCPK